MYQSKITTSPWVVAAAAGGGAAALAVSSGKRVMNFVKVVGLPGLDKTKAIKVSIQAVVQ